MKLKIDAYVATLLCAGAAVLAMPASADIVTLSGALDSSQVVVPVGLDPNTNEATGSTPLLNGNTKAGGFAIVTIDTIAETLTLDFSWHDLTGPADRSHLHDAPAGVARQVPPNNMFFDEVIRNDVDFTDPSNPIVNSSSINGGPVLCDPSDPLSLDCAPATGSLSVVDDISDPGFFADNGQFADFDSLLAAFEANGMFLDIHTVAFPGGEIRGQLLLNSVPEPGTFALLGFGLAGIGLSRRNRA